MDSFVGRAYFLGYESAPGLETRGTFSQSVNE